MRSKRDREDGFYFEGFSSPNTTPVPDEVFDVLAPRLSEAELRVLLYILRRTFGFKKRADAISLQQLVKGIRTRSGVVLDEGTGMSKRGVLLGLRGLVKKGVIEVRKAVGEDGQHEVNVYSLRFRDGSGSSSRQGNEPRPEGTDNHGVVYEGYYRSNRSIQGDVNDGAAQQTVVQGTDSESTTGRRKRRTHNVVADPMSRSPDIPGSVEPAQEAPQATNKETRQVVMQLREIGVHPKTAERLVRENDLERVRELLDYLVWRAERGWVPEVSAAGWIVAALRDDYVLPEQFRAWRMRTASRAVQAGAEALCPENEVDSARVERLRRLGVSEADQRLWREALSELKRAGQWTPALSMAVVRQVGTGRFDIVVPWASLARRVEKRREDVKAALRALVGADVEVSVVVA